MSSSANEKASDKDVASAIGQVKFSSLLWQANFENDPLMQPLQWHIWCDGKETISAIQYHKKWADGPPLDVAATNSGRLIADHAMSMVKRGFQGKKAPTLGLVFHIADEFNTSPLRSDFIAPGRYDLGEVMCVGEPASIVEGDYREKMNYRYVPLPGARSALAVHISRERWAVLEGLMSIRSPIRVATLSAPLSLVALLPAIVDPVATEHAIEYFLLQYHRMTIVAAMRPPDENEAGTPSGLTTIMVLPHGGRSAPSNVGNRIASDLMIRNAARATIHVVGASRDADIENTASQIEAGVTQFAERMQLDMTVAGYDDFAGEVARRLDLPSIPGRPEFLIAGRKYLTWDGAAEKWYSPEERASADQVMHALVQNYSNRSLTIEENRVTYADALAVVLGRVAFVLGVLVCAGALVFAGIRVSLAMSSPYWDMDESHMSATTAALAAERAINEANRYWSVALLPRSLGWIVMEGLCSVIADDTGLTVERVDYKVEALPIDPKIKAGGGVPQTLGYRMIWRIEGVADSQGASILDSIQSSDVGYQIVRTIASAMELSGFHEDIADSALPPASVQIERSQRGAAEGEAKFTFLVSQVIPDTATDLAIPNNPKTLPAAKAVIRSQRQAITQ